MLSPDQSIRKVFAANEDYCCECCFEHQWLRAPAREDVSHQGACFYCGTEGLLISVRALHDGIAHLLSDYIPASSANGGGDSFFPSVSPLTAIQRDWHLFSTSFDMGKGEYFLPAVFKRRPLPERLSSLSEPVVAFHRNAMSTAYGKWLAFWLADTAAFDGQHAPADIEIPGTFVNQAASHLMHFKRAICAGQRLWRARTNYVGSSALNAQPLPLRKMGSNPRYPASRLNRDGEVIFYCAEAEKTAIAEVRPGTGYICTTCEVVLNRELSVLDLASPLDSLNPFECEDLSWKLDLHRVARNLTREVAQPMSRGEDGIVYLKPQFLSLVVRAMGLDGVRFCSSIDATGVNLALFDPTAVTLSSLRLVKVTQTEIEYEELPDC